MELPDSKDTEQKQSQESQDAAEEAAKEAATAQAEGAEEAEGDDEGEPGGSDPQAVRARKEYRRAKRLSEELQAVREQAIAAEARAKALEEASKKPAEEKKPERRFTEEELQQAVEDGRITQAVAWAYIKETAKLETKAEIRNELRSESQQERGQQILKGVQRDLDAYKGHVPELARPGSKTWQDVKREYDYLVSERGYEDSTRTELLAAERVLGPLSKFEKRKETTRLTRESADFHAENGGGGREAEGNSVDRMPESYKQMWDKRGTTAEERKKEAAIYWQQQKSGSKRLVLA